MGLRHRITKICIQPLIEEQENNNYAFLTQTTCPGLLFAAMASTALLSGCAVHARIYDSYYHDYHAWNDHEVVYYGQWEHETHRDHVDFKKRKDVDQKEYWTWRHNHPDQH